MEQEYLLLTSPDGQSLQEMVNKSMLDGWTASGGIAVTHVGHNEKSTFLSQKWHYAQALVRERSNSAKAVS